MEAIKFSELPSGDRLPLTDDAFFPIVANNENRTLTYERLKNQLAEQTHTDKVADLEETKVPTAGAVEKRVRTTENNMKTLETLAQAAHYKAENIEKKVDANTKAIQTADQKIDTTKSELQGKITAADGKIDKTKTELEGKITQAEGKIAPAVNSAKEELNGTLTQNKTELEGKIDQAKGELEGKITETESKITPAVNSAKEELNKTISQNKSELEQKIEEIELTPGPKGDKGEPGPAGPIGPVGPAGKDGENGAVGERGERGEKGPKGDDGLTPTINPENKHWMIGGDDTGVSAAGEGTGPQGPAGKDGANGKSAYEIWKEQDGNSEKSVEQFLASLKGAKGDKGDEGAPGATGPAGPAGEAGKDGAEGPRGEQGPAGPKGDPGTALDLSGVVYTSSLAWVTNPGTDLSFTKSQFRSGNEPKKAGDIFLTKMYGSNVALCKVTELSDDGSGKFQTLTYVDMDQINGIQAGVKLEFQKSNDDTTPMTDFPLTNKNYFITKACAATFTTKPANNATYMRRFFLGLYGDNYLGLFKYMQTDAQGTYQVTHLSSVQLPAGGGGDTSALESRISTIETEIESLKSDIQTLLNAINTALEEIK